MFLFYPRRRYPLLGLLGACVALVPLIILSIQAALAATPFMWMRPKALAACKACYTAQMDGTKPYRMGRVLVVNSSGAAFGLVLANKALAGIAATAPDKVGTLICVGEPVSVQMGTTPTGVKLYRIYRDVCLIEWSTGRVIYRTSLAGSQLCISSYSGDVTQGSDPFNAELIDFIVALPVE